MNYKAKSIRTFLGAKNYNESRTFYTELGFEEVVLSPKMSLFKLNEDLGFYLQDYYVKKWCNNSMVFLEVDDLDKCWNELHGKDLDGKYKYVRFTEIKQFDWGREFFMHDPSGVLWHFGEFNDWTFKMKNAASRLGHLHMSNRGNKYSEFRKELDSFRINHTNEINSYLTSVSNHIDQIEKDFKGEIPNIEVIRNNRYLDKIMWTTGR